MMDSKARANPTATHVMDVVWLEPVSGQTKGKSC